MLTAAADPGGPPNRSRERKCAVLTNEHVASVWVRVEHTRAEDLLQDAAEQSPGKLPTVHVQPVEQRTGPLQTHRSAPIPSPVAS